MQGKVKKQDQKSSQKQITTTLDIDIDINELDIQKLQNDDKDSILMTLKDIHMKQQNQLVKDLKYMSQQSKKIINDIVGIEDQIQHYQSQIDSWIKNITQFQNFVEKVNGHKRPFKIKAQNSNKLKDYLYAQKKRR